MSNSSLVSYTRISPNRTSPRDHSIDTITIHCYVGQVSVQDMGAWFAQSAAQSSCNYGIGKDGSVGMFVEEKDRSWCSSNRANDMRAITIECASDKTDPYAINSKVYATLIKLCADICKRNGIKKLVWSTDKNTRVNHLNGCNLTVHRDYAAKACPGDYIYSRLGQIAKEVNALLGAGGSSEVTETKWYRVRKSWTDEKSQIGAYISFEKAKEDCPIGYSVYDYTGKAVFTKTDANSSAQPSVSTSTPPYRVRKSWADASSQLGAFDVLDNAKAACKEGYTVYDSTGKAVYSVAPRVVTIDNMVGTDLNGLSEAEKIAKVAPIYQKVMKETGMLASVGLAQFCLESGYATTDLGQKANNMHGMKCSLSGNTWAGSVWDGKSKYTKQTAEQTPTGQVYYVKADFRKYPSILKSVQDRAAYFIGAWLDAAKTKKRYPNVNMIKDTEAQIKLLKSGGYATDVNYVSKLMNIVNRFNLTQYDKGITPSVWTTSVNNTTSNTAQSATTTDYYRVAKSYSNGKYTDQEGAYTSKDNAIAACKVAGASYSVFDPKGVKIYPEAAKEPQKASQPAPAASGDIYWIQRTMEQTEYRLGKFSVLDNAKKLADQNWGYKVWDSTTKKCVYEPKLNNTQKFIAKLVEMDQIVQSDIKAGKSWSYKNTNTSTISKTFDKARSDNNRKVNCACGVYWGLIGSGVVNKNRDGIQWYGHNGFVWCGSNAKANALKYFDLITVKNKTLKQCIKDGTVQPGDILSYVDLGHTNVYIGNNQSFDAGHKNCSGSGEGAKFKCFISSTGYTGYKVAQILRLRNSNVQYRVQCGVYSVKKNAENYAKKVKEKGFDVMLVQEGKNWVVQCGLFSNRDNADALFKKIISKGLSCMVTEVKT